MEALASLVLAAQDGDKEAFGKIVKRFQDVAYAIAYGILGKDTDLAEDAAQDALIEAYLCLPKLRDPVTFPKWFRQIVVKRCDRLLRRRHLTTVPLEMAMNVPSGVPDPVTVVETHEIQSLVREAVEDLPNHERLVTTLFYIAEYSYSEIAALLEIPMSTVKKQLYTARRRLRGRMMDLVKDYLQNQRPSRDDQFVNATARILFCAECDSHTQLYVMDADGSHPTRLTHNTANDHQPTWSPDGTKIAFRSDRDGCFQIYVMDADGSNQTRLTYHAALDHSPVWSPDGTKIVFTSKPTSGYDSDYEIYMVDAEGNHLTRLTYNTMTDFDPVWSPDGRKIAFASRYDDSSYEIYMMDVDGSHSARLTSNAAHDVHPAWSPDGRKIAFASNRDGHYEIYVMNADGTNQTRLTYSTARNRNPAWSPDGRKIAFVSNRDGHYEIYVMNADGTNQTRLTYMPKGNACDPWWSPDFSDSRNVVGFDNNSG
ncbi:MAG: sigma-70 family RNA polymerase sigma factor [Candidatus Latescibacteria bacterium]|nr:sigma-70 family RNA polymerase sigma factor [Candidatus Latescibacterota bacterium]